MQIPDRLQNAIRGRRLIPFAGAGVSMAVRKDDRSALFPSWPELLNQAAAMLEQAGEAVDASLVINLVVKKEFLEAARRAKEALGSAEWSRSLVRAFDVDTDQIDPATLALPKALWALGSPAVITTNYDKVLRLASPNPGDLNVWDIESTAGLAELLDGTGRKPALWHLHGKIDNASRLILTPDGYQKLYGPDVAEADYKTALASLQSILRSHTLLFVGFSFEDPGIGSELRAFDDVMQGQSGPHYAIVREQDADKVRSLGLPIEPLTVESFGAPMVALLEELAALRDAPPATGTGTAAAPTELEAKFDPKKPAFHVPFRAKGERVIGRDQALADVRAQLVSGAPTSIGQTAFFRGLGGLGKTQLAVEYAHWYRDQYPSGVVWLTADGEMAAQLVEVAETAGWVSPQSDHEFKLTTATRRVREFDGGLVVFDNVERREDIEPYLPLPSATPHLLLTSRREIADFVPIDLNKLETDDALRLLIQESGRTPDGEEAAAARRIAERLDGLPLALELAGAYLRHREGVTFAEYENLLAVSLTDALEARLLASMTRHDADLARTLAVHEGVLEEAPALRDVLDVLTWSASAPMSFSLMQALLPDIEAVALRKALALGETLRLLQSVPDEPRYAVHRLLAEVRREQTPLDGPWAEATARHLADWFRERRKDFQRLSEYEADVDHLDAWRQHVRLLNMNLGVELLWLQASPPQYRGQVTLAAERVEQALKEFRPADEWRELEAHLFHDRGVTLNNLGLQSEALDGFQQSLAIRLKIFGEHHPDTATSLASVAVSLGNVGQHKEMLSEARHALAIRRKIWGNQHEDTAESFDIVSYAFSYLNKHEDDLEMAEMALAIRRKVLGEHHPDTAASFESVAGTLNNLAQHGKALENAQKSLAIRREALGERHPITARSFNAVAISLSYLGQLTEAQRHAPNAVDVSDAALGATHPNTLRHFRTLCTILQRRGQGRKAHTLIRDYLARVDRDHPTHRELKDLQRDIESTLPGFRRR